MARESSSGAGAAAPPGEWVGFRVILREVRIHLALEAVEPLRVGAGRAESPEAIADLPVYRRRVCINGGCDNLPVIPGSSLKGVLRTVSATLSTACGIEAHGGITRYNDDCVTQLFGKVKNFDDFRSSSYKSGMVSRVKNVLMGFCPTCLMYGAPSVAGRVSVGDFQPVPETLRIGVKTGVGINRRTGAAARNVLYNVEYVEPGSVFRGEIRAVNTPNWMLALLAAALKALDDGFAKVGGFKSRGMGRVRIVVDDETPRILIYPIGGRVIGVLDSDADREAPLPEDCAVKGGLAECRGSGAKRLIDSLAESWYSTYCAGLRNVYPARVERARSIAESMVEGAGEGW